MNSNYNSSASGYNLVGPNLPSSYNEFDFFDNNYPPNNIIAKFNENNTFLRPLENENNTPFSSADAAAPRISSLQHSKMLNNNARRARLAKMNFSIKSNKNKKQNRQNRQNPNLKNIHRRTPQQRLNNSYKAIKDPLHRIASHIANEPTYLPNIAKNMSRKTVKKRSPLTRTKSHKNKN